MSRPTRARVARVRPSARSQSRKTGTGFGERRCPWRCARGGRRSARRPSRRGYCGVTSRQRNPSGAAFSGALA
jgi:hypothetical protein